jgi:hypothetical protein
MKRALSRIFVGVLALIFSTAAAFGAGSTTNKQDKEGDGLSQESNNGGDFEADFAPSWQSTSLQASRSVARKRVTSSIRINNEEKLQESKFRMKDCTLAQQVAFLSNNETLNSFETLLQMEEERQKEHETILAASSNMAPTISPFFLGVLTSSGFLALSSWFLNPLSTQSVWKQALSKRIKPALGLAWLPLIWEHPAKLAFVDLLLLGQILRQPTVYPYIQKEVIPFAWKTFQTMILTEVWTRIWKWLFLHVDQVRQALGVGAEVNNGSVSENGRDEQHHPSTFGILEWPKQYPLPSWLVDVHSLVVGGVQRGIKNSFKKSFQEAIMSALSVWRDALSEQLLVP